MIPLVLVYITVQVNKLVRCLKLLLEYIIECDNEHMEERGIPPHGKYVGRTIYSFIYSFIYLFIYLFIYSTRSYWGKPLSLTIRYCSTQNSQPEDFDIWPTIMIP